MKKIIILLIIGLLIIGTTNLSAAQIHGMKSSKKIIHKQDKSNVDGPPDIEDYAFCGYIKDRETKSTARLYSKEYSSKEGDLYFQWNGHYDTDKILPSYWGAYTSIKDSKYSTQPPEDLKWNDEQPTGEQQGGVKIEYTPSDENNEWVVHLNCLEVEIDTNTKEYYHVYFEFQTDTHYGTRIDIDLDFFKLLEGELPIKFHTEFTIDMHTEYFQDYWKEINRTVKIRNYKVLSARYQNILGHTKNQLQFYGPQEGKDTFDLFEINEPYEQGEYTLKTRLYRFSSPFNYQEHEQGSKITVNCDYEGFDLNSKYDKKSEIAEIKVFNYPEQELIQIDESNIVVPIPPVSELIDEGYIESDNGLAVFDFDIKIYYDYEIPASALCNPFFYMDKMKTYQYVEAKSIVYGKNGWNYPYEDSIKINRIPIQFKLIA